MPKFYCSHCGQHIDASDALAGTRAACPTCSGDVLVPRVVRESPPPTFQQPVFEEVEMPAFARPWRSYFGKLGYLLAAGLCLTAAVVIGNSGDDFPGGHVPGSRGETEIPWSAEARPAAVSQEAPAKAMVVTAAGGLVLQLPVELATLTGERSAGGGLELLEKHASAAGSRSFVLKHFVFKSMYSVPPGEAADMMEQGIKDQPAYRATRQAVNVAGAGGLILEAHYKEMGKSVAQTNLYFSQGRESWEIQLTGLDDPNPAALSAVAREVIASIVIKGSAEGQQ